MENAHDWYWNWRGIQKTPENGRQAEARGENEKGEEQSNDDEDEVEDCPEEEEEDEVEDCPADPSDSTEPPSQFPDGIEQKGSTKRNDLASRLEEFYPDLMDDGMQREEDVVDVPEQFVGDFFSPDEEDRDEIDDHNVYVQPAMLPPDLRTPTSLPVSFGPRVQADSLGDAGHRTDAAQAGTEHKKPQEPEAQQHESPQQSEPVSPGPTADPVIASADPVIEGKSSSAVPEKATVVPDQPDDVVGFLGRLQLSLPVPPVGRLRDARPLKIAPNEFWATQFVLHRTQQEFQAWMNNDAMHEFHPHMQEGDGGFGFLDDGTLVTYQKNGIARLMEPSISKPIRCDKTGAPGFYSEMNVTCARLKVGKSRGGLAGAQTIKTRKLIEDHLFYKFKSCWLYLACAGFPGEFGEEDDGNRVFLRRSGKDFRQYAFFDFPLAKQLCDLLEAENTVFLKKFTYQSSKNMNEQALVHYDRASLRAWQAFEFDGKPPPDDAARMLVQAARTGHSNELRRLVQKRNFDCNLVLTEFGLFGSGRQGSFLRSANAYAEERTALVAAIEKGWESIVGLVIEFAEQGKADLNTLCSEWNPEGAGGPGLREHYTALDMARIYHRYEIHSMLERAGAKTWREVITSRHRMRENPFHTRQRHDAGDYGAEEDYYRYQSREEEFSFADFDGHMAIDPEMEEICKGIRIEMRDNLENKDTDISKFWKKLQLRWHPDKQPDEKKELGTKIFQWIQHQKDNAAWENKAWSA